ncbi:MAG: diguanylate cyclase [Gemmatimonadales bacterium]|nr:MAG: diguanylate cyclase [Gemmatimonadales bacterium]
MAEFDFDACGIYSFAIPMAQTTRRIMPADWTVLYYNGGSDPPPELVRGFAEARGLDLAHQDSPEAVLHHVKRALPACLLVDVSGGRRGHLELCRRIKSDPFSSILPVAVLLEEGDGDDVADALEAGADEVITLGGLEREAELRLDLLLRRATRDVSVHPTTRLPGTPQIERDLTSRLSSGDPFAFCYADLDHFKEFNDRYGYNRGDRVIYLVSLILKDLVRGLAPGGFVGHIGGDDFIFTVPLDRMEDTCDEVLDLFDELIPWQYTHSDRDTGYFLGRDRRGTLHRVPLMTLSIGVVTNLSRAFRHPAQVSSRAAEMKSYAKTLPGSVYVVDRRNRSPGPSRDFADAGRRVVSPASPPAGPVLPLSQDLPEPS